MDKYPVEVFNIGFADIEAIQNAIAFLNTHQRTFHFMHVKEQRFETCQAKQDDHFSTEEIYDLLDKVLTDLKGIHNFAIAVVNKRLDGKTWRNLFCSMETNRNKRLTGKAIVSSYGIDRFPLLLPVDVYYIFEFLSFSIRFIVGKGLIHDRERGCLFHRKANKADILEVIKAGYISLESQQQINKYLELEQIIAFRTLLSIISDIARSDKPRENLQQHLRQHGNKQKRAETVGDSSQSVTIVNTGGGTYVAGNANIGGDLIGRDMNSR